MKTIDVIGIEMPCRSGFQVSDAFLQQHRLEKGMMALIEEDDQSKLITELSKLGELKNNVVAGRRPILW